jgi:hypothetical protein
MKDKKQKNKQKIKEVMNADFLLSNSSLINFSAFSIVFCVSDGIVLFCSQKRK